MLSFHLRLHEFPRRSPRGERGFKAVKVDVGIFYLRRSPRGERGFKDLSMRADDDGFIVALREESGDLKDPQGYKDERTIGRSPRGERGFKAVRGCSIK